MLSLEIKKSWSCWNLMTWMINGISHRITHLVGGGKDARQRLG